MTWHNARPDGHRRRWPPPNGAHPYSAGAGRRSKLEYWQPNLAAERGREVDCPRAARL